MKCVVALAEKDIDKATIFICEAGPKPHDFTLKSAIRMKMFTPEQVESIRKRAQEHREKFILNQYDGLFGGGDSMDIVRRAYLQAMQEMKAGATVEQLQDDMILRMVRWVKNRVYSKRDWPRELGEYPKHRESEITD